MHKKFSGGSTINYGSALPPVDTAVNGLLYHVNTGTKKGLYILSNPPSTTNLSQGPHAWHPVIETELYVLRAGDTMTGALTLKQDGNANNITAPKDSLNFLTTNTYLNHHYGAMRWKVGGSTNAQISATTIGNNGETAIVLSTRGPEGALVERLRIDHNGLKFGTHTVWHSGNDGAGSGLDADLLDGKHGDYYLDLGNATGKLPESAFPFMPVEQGGVGTQKDTKINIGESASKSGRLGLKMGNTDHGDKWPIDIDGTAMYFWHDIRMTVGNSTKSFNNGPIHWPLSHVTFGIHQIGAVVPRNQANLGSSFYVDPVGGVDDIENGHGSASKPYKSIAFICNYVLPRYTGMVTIALANRGIHDTDNFYFLHSHPISLVAWNAFGSGKPTIRYIGAICPFLNVTGLRINCLEAMAATQIGIFDCEFIGAIDLSHGVKGNAVVSGASSLVGFLGNIKFSGTYNSGFVGDNGAIKAYPTGNSTFDFTSRPRFNTAFVHLFSHGTAEFVRVTSMVGSFTGSRFKLDSGSRLYTGTGNLNLFPGTSAGTIDSPPGLPSQYY